MVHPNLKCWMYQRLYPLRTDWHFLSQCRGKNVVFVVVVVVVVFVFSPLDILCMLFWKQNRNHPCHFLRLPGCLPYVPLCRYRRLRHGDCLVDLHWPFRGSWKGQGGLEGRCEEEGGWEGVLNITLVRETRRGNSKGQIEMTLMFARGLFTGITVNDSPTLGTNYRRGITKLFLWAIRRPRDNWKVCMHWWVKGKGMLRAYIDKIF